MIRILLAIGCMTNIANGFFGTGCHPALMSSGGYFGSADKSLVASGAVRVARVTVFCKNSITGASIAKKRTAAGRTNSKMRRLSISWRFW